MGGSYLSLGIEFFRCQGDEAVKIVSCAEEFKRFMKSNDDPLYETRFAGQDTLTKKLRMKNR